MSAWLIAAIGVVYAVVAFDLIRNGNLGLGIAFVGYSIGNIGLTMEAMKVQPMTYDQKLRYLFNRKLDYRLYHQGIIIDGKILIAKEKSRWKKLGDRDWHSYYGLGNLCDALENGTLDEYAQQQDLCNTRKHLSIPVNNTRTRKAGLYPERKL